MKTTTLNTFPIQLFKSKQTWEAWLEKNHRKSTGLWLRLAKKDSRVQSVSYKEALEVALCYGWIDGIVKPIDAVRWTQRFSPRRSTSRLSAMNRERVRRLIAAGRMTKAGLASIAHTFDHKKDTKPRLRWKVPADIERRLQEDAAVWKHYRRFPESYRRIRIGWIDAGRRRREVFEQRLRYFIKMTAQNKRFGMVQ